MAGPIIRWGILGTGSIARLFAAGLTHVADARLVAVGSRSAASADRFADDFGIPRRHASAEALAADPGVDIVYIASPHVAHREQTSPRPSTACCGTPRRWINSTTRARRWARTPWP